MVSLCPNLGLGFRLQCGLGFNVTFTAIRIRVWGFGLEFRPQALGLASCQGNKNTVDRLPVGELLKSGSLFGAVV